MWLAICLLFLSSTISAREFTDEEISQLPPLFHLDNYDRCLSQKNGLYCLGIFHITPEKQTTYELIKEYTESPFKYNRTLLHRGYCVSARCPARAGAALQTRNSSLRFERCAAQWGRARAMRTRLHTLHYCRTHQEVIEDDIPTTPQTIFIKVVYLLLFLNLVGTLYDIITGDNPRKNKILAAWSIPANWRRLTATYVDGDPRLSALAPFQGFRILAILTIMYAHANIQVFRYYVGNPERGEKDSNGLYGAVLSNGTSIVHVFITMSAFLTTYNLLIYSEKHQLSLHMLPYCIIKRVIRMSPLSLFIIGYAATWFPYAREGPLISPILGKESKVCQRKFWSHVFYINNIVDPDDNCIAPTWFVAVDMHLYILTCFLTLSGWLRSRALTVYPALVVASTIFNVLMAYIHNYKSMVNFTTPQHVHEFFKGVTSFSHFYYATWAALPSCFIGLYMAHLHYELQKKKYNGNNNILLVLFTNLAIPLTIIWGFMGIYVRTLSTPLYHAVYLGIDRTAYVLIDAVMLFGIINIKGPITKFYSWSGWQAMGRMSLSVMLLHWCVNMIIAARPYVHAFSYLNNFIDALATSFITYTLAIPLTILVETPMQRFLNALIF